MSDPVDAAVCAAIAAEQAPAGPAGEAPATPATDSVDPSVETPEDAAQAPAKAGVKYPTLTPEQQRIIDEGRAKKAATPARAAAPTPKAPAAPAIDPLEAFRARAKSDPLAALKDLGLTYEDLTTHVLAGGGKDDGAPLTKKDLEALREDLRREEAAKTSAATKAQQEQAFEAFVGNASKFIADRAADFELVSVFADGPMLAKTVETYFERTGRLLSLDEAAKMLESHFESQQEKVLGTKKLQSKLGLSSPAGVAKPSAAPRAQASSPTLTNAATGATAAKAPWVDPSLTND